MTGNYWTRRLGRRGFVGGAAAGGTGLAALALAGCGDDDDAPSGGGTTPAGGGAGPTATVDVTKLPDAEFFARITSNPAKDWKDEDIKPGGTFVRISNRPAPSLDPMTQTTGGTSDLTTPVYNSLLRLPAGQGQKDIYETTIEGNLATAWEQPDPRTVILTLAPGIKWQNVAPLNGRDFTVGDIQYSFDRGRSFNKSAHKGNYTNIEKVEDAGGGKVRITLIRPNPATTLALASWTTLIIPKELGDSPDTAATKAVGTGGFIMDKVTPNVEVVFKKNPDYFKKDKLGRKLPYIDGYTVSYATDPATLTALFEGGKADFYYGTAHPFGQGVSGWRAFMSRNPKLVYQKTSSVNGTYAYIPHHKKPPFNDVRVRRAMSLAFDRKSIIDALHKGQATVLPWFLWSAALTQKPTLNDMGPWYKYDPAQAKQLLSAAGFPNGLTLDLQWQYDQQSEVELFKQNLEAAGIKVNLTKSTAVADHTGLYLRKEWKDLILVGRGLNYPDINEIMAHYTPVNSPLNYGELDDTELNALLNKQFEMPQGPERRAVHKQAWDRLLDQVPEIMNPSADQLQSWQPTLQNWVVMSWPSNAGTGSGQMDSVWRRA